MIFRSASELDQHLVRRCRPHRRLSKDTVMPPSPAPRAGGAARPGVPPDAELRRATASTPVATGIANRRLRNHSTSGRGRYRLGAYGWLDGPFGGKPGPTAAKRLHARSACAGADEHHPARQVFNVGEGTGGGSIGTSGQMNLSSPTVRLAMRWRMSANGVPHLRDRGTPRRGCSRAAGSRTRPWPGEAPPRGCPDARDTAMASRR